MPISYDTKQILTHKGLLLVVAAIVLAVFVWLVWRLPDPEIFNKNVERIFVETDLTTQADIKLLEVLASSGSLFEQSLNLHREIIMVLVGLTLAMVLLSLGLLLSNVSLRQQYQDQRNRALTVTSVGLNRNENTVQINGDVFTLTRANIDTLALFLEARLDAEYLSGLDVESVLSGKPKSDCEEAAGVVRIKRLRDALGNQIVSDLLLRHVPGRGYVLNVPREQISLD